MNEISTIGVKGLGASCAIKFNDKWTVYGDKGAVLYEDGFCYKVNLDIDDILSLPEDTPIYASEGCFFGKNVDGSGIVGTSEEYTDVKAFKELVNKTLDKIVDCFSDFDDPDFKLKADIKTSSVAFKEIAECIFEYVSWE